MNEEKQLSHTFFKTCKAFENTQFITQRHEVMQMVLAEMADNLNKLDVASKSVKDMRENVSNSTNYRHVQATARAFLDVDETTRLTVIADIMSWHIGHSSFSWLDLNSSRQFVKLLGKASAIRCSFSYAAMPALVAAFDARQANQVCHVRFVDHTVGQSELVQLVSVAIGADVEVVIEHPFVRKNESEFDAELCFPPFGMDFNNRDLLPDTTLDVMGVSEKGRLQHEGIAIADALVHASKCRVVLGHSAGVLFRSVGVEALMRQELIGSGRLSSILSVPPGMVYPNTGIESAVLLLEPDTNAERAVRFIDLADDTLSKQKQASRAQREMRNEVTWRDIVGKKLQGDEPWARDVLVSELKKHNGILSVHRYLQSEASQAFDSYLSTKNTQPLSDLATIQRPRALRKSDSSEVVIREALLSDIDETGYLSQPARQTRIARGDLHHARNQGLYAGDIVVSIKGAIAHVGIVPDSAPEEDENEFWTAGQSFLILRPKGSGAIETLYEYLTNDIVQSHLASLAKGTLMPMLNIKELKSLPVPVITEKEHLSVKKAFQERQERFKSIEALRTLIAKERSVSWPHNELKKSSDE